MLPADAAIHELARMKAHQGDDWSVAFAPTDASRAASHTCSYDLSVVIDLPLPRVTCRGSIETTATASSGGH